MNDYPIVNIVRPVNDGSVGLCRVVLRDNEITLEGHDSDPGRSNYIRVSPGEFIVEFTDSGQALVSELYGFNVPHEDVVAAAVTAERALLAQPESTLGERASTPTLVRPRRVPGLYRVTSPGFRTVRPHPCGLVVLATLWTEVGTHEEQLLWAIRESPHPNGRSPFPDWRWSTELSPLLDDKGQPLTHPVLLEALLQRAAAIVRVPSRADDSE